QNTHWVCKKQAPGSINENPTSQSAGASRTTRGANFGTSDLCEARLRWRRGMSKPQSESDEYTGIRCARSL
ncbi:MAG: hypothetical protein ACI9OJ_002938, partial [Myxococcota bacterium]